MTLKETKQQYQTSKNLQVTTIEMVNYKVKFDVRISQFYADLFSRSR